MINGADTRRVYESFTRGDSAFHGLSGPRGFNSLLRDMLGLRPRADGRMVLHPTMEDGSGRLAPEAFSIKDLAEGICGENWVRSLDPRRAAGGVVVESGVPTPESAPGAINPGNFPNTSAYYGSVSGLMEAKVLEEYTRPEFVADRVMPAIPTRFRQEKMPGAARIGDQAKPMVPAQSHPRANFGERWVLTPETQKNGLAVDVTTEAVFFDLTTQILARAASIGYELGLRKEKRCLRVFTGLDNPYVYMGTAYNTYLTSGNWINKIASNGLVNWLNIDVARVAFSRMTDQEASERITVTPDTIVVSPARETSTNYVLSATEVERRANSAAEILRAPNSERGRYSVVVSPYVEQVLIDSGIAAANAQEYWFLLAARKAFAYMENWSMKTKTASPNDYVMADSDLLFSMFVNEMGVPTVLEPRYVIQSYVA